MQKSSNQIKTNNIEVVAGVDEVGRGALAGPVVTTAIILTKDCPINELKDSKELSEKKRNDLYIKLLKTTPYIRTAIINNNVIDTINILNSRLSNVKNKAIDVWTKAFSMVSEVANKPFEGKSTNLEEGKEFDINNDNQNANNERIEPSFIDNNEQKNYGQVSYEDNFDRGLVSDDDKMNIPSFLRRNRD